MSMSHQNVKSYFVLQDHGLLSAQLHPDFPMEPYLFLFYSVAPDGW